MDELNEIKVEEAPVQKELSFDEMLEETLKTIYNGDKVKGVVVAITGTEISVDLGTKYSGFIPTSEFTDDGIKVEDAVKVGDEIEAVVVRVNDVEGTAQLSKKRLDAAKSWTDVETAAEDGTILEGVVTLRRSCISRSMKGETGRSARCVKRSAFGSCAWSASGKVPLHSVTCRAESGVI